MKRSKTDTDMRAEYDFSNARRNRHAKRYAEGTNIVLLDPDVAEAFPTGEKVNAALRKLIKPKRKR
jgi:hypothetical protein